jgi:hypothetical protein
MQGKKLRGHPCGLCGKVCVANGVVRLLLIVEQLDDISQSIMKRRAIMTSSNAVALPKLPRL